MRQQPLTHWSMPTHAASPSRSILRPPPLLASSSSSYPSTEPHAPTTLSVQNSLLLPHFQLFFFHLILTSQQPSHFSLILSSFNRHSFCFTCAHIYILPIHFVYRTKYTRPHSLIRYTITKFYLTFILCVGQYSLLSNFCILSLSLQCLSVSLFVHSALRSRSL